MDPILHTFGQELPKMRPLIVTELVCSVFAELFIVLIKSHPHQSGFIFCNGSWMERGEEGGFHLGIQDK